MPQNRNYKPVTITLGPHVRTMLDELVPESKQGTRSGVIADLIWEEWFNKIGPRKKSRKKSELPA